jgi:hypothetical protein
MKFDGYFNTLYATRWIASNVASSYTLALKRMILANPNNAFSIGGTVDSSNTVFVCG